VILVLALLATARGVHTQANERELYVSVVDANGKPVTGLRADEFVVREDGVRREVLRAIPATTPMDVALLVDNSQAVGNAVLTDLRKGLEGFVTAMAGKNQVAYITFGERPTIVVEYTTDAAKLAAAVNRFFPITGSGAYLLEAIVETSRGLRAREPERPVIVAVLVEDVEFSTRHYDQVIEAIKEAGAAFHVVMLTRPRPDRESDEVQARNIVIDRGTRESGGRRQHILTSMAFPDALADLAAELKNQYRVVYGSPRGLIPSEQVEVSVTRPGLTARGTPVKPPRRSG
jgi:VWFA-related protein